MQSFCRTCFLQISDTLLAPLDHKSYKRLIFCIPEMDLRAFPGPKSCKKCIIALNAMYKFKMKCREVETQINKRRFDMTEHSMVTQDIRLGYNTYTVCRTCLTDDIDKSIHLVERSFYLSKLMICVPEMDIHIILDLNLCKNCHTILDKIYLFKKKCLDLDKNIKEYLKLHDKLDFRDLSVWCNTFVKLEVNDLEDYTTKQEEVDLVNEDKLMKNLKEQVTNVALISLKTEGLKTCECMEKTSKYQNCNCNNSICDNVKYLNSKYDYNAVQKSNLLKHIHSHTSEKTFKCSLCEFSATKKSHLETHIRTHTGEKPFKCVMCQYTATQKSNLKLHIRTHTGEKPFKCAQCEYSAAKKSHLKYHILTHTSEKPFKCTLCEYSAAQKSHLKNHMRTHTSEKPFKCTLCDYSASQKSNLKNHIRTHTGEKPFKCALCEYTAAQKVYLKLHIRTHTGEKPFKCSLCKYSSACKSTLTNHIRTHTGEKPFKCLYCEYSATNKSSLSNHLLTHIGENS